MLAIFAADGDIHDATTRAMYGMSLEQWEALDKKERSKMRTPVKQLQFGLVYGLTAPGLQQGLMINNPPIYWTVEECQAFIDQWYALYPGVKHYMEEIYMNARRYGVVWDMFGRIRLIPGIRSIHPWIQSAALREAGNMPIQSGAQGVLKLAMAQIEAECDTVFRSNDIYVEPLLQVHDELIWDVAEEYVEGVSDYLGQVMGGVMQLRCPLKSADGWGLRWEK